MFVNMDLRVFFVGDSFVVGVGDPEYRGWVGRVAACSCGQGSALTAYNLGVRRDTSGDVRRRWPREVATRRAAQCEERLVVSFGVNDTTAESGRPRVDPAEQNIRIGALDESFREACAAAGVPYAGVFDALIDEPVWMDEVRCGDGAHPGAGGYELLAAAVLPVWRRWIGQPDSGTSGRQNRFGTST